ncbi:hypothetical protein FN846DRAFT_998039 [Sphaerosporella brunnea]|uniref:Uncharacterized protein n=1 Tax=Sphaerosporella brunnea TaxID=1250544 RepID=A0A5J5F693_9PEZI|nr:hypothetical protein FN846DRAFT_998039 [Sphaerosporella brunnea]
MSANDNGPSTPKRKTIPLYDSHRILTERERRELFLRLPATPLPAELRTPSVMIGAPYPAIPPFAARNDIVPVHRRIFRPGKHQYISAPEEKDYFSVTDKGDEGRPIILPSGLRCDEMNKRAQEEMERREDEKKYGIHKPPGQGQTPEEDEVFWKKLAGDLLYGVEVLSGAILLLLAVKFLLPVLVLALLAMSLIMAWRKKRRAHIGGDGEIEAEPVGLVEEEEAEEEIDDAMEYVRVDHYRQYQGPENFEQQLQRRNTFDSPLSLRKRVPPTAFQRRIQSTESLRKQVLRRSQMLTERHNYQNDEPFTTGIEEDEDSETE